jgi:hypothetical protein
MPHEGRRTPQASTSTPQVAGRLAQMPLGGMHWYVAGSQRLAPEQGQVKVPPHPSSCVMPHAERTSAQVFFLQPQRFAMPVPPQVLGAAQVPQSSTLPHSTRSGPQSAPAPSQVLARQPQRLATPPAPQ